MLKTFLFCGVESTGKTTAIENAYKYLVNKGLKVKMISEAGRDICEESGGVFEMTLLDYERILHLHQTNFLKEFTNKQYDIILLDTDSTYTRYYLEKDVELLKENPSLCQKLITLSEDIIKINLENKRITEVIYLNSDCPFIQDGTRTYESTRKEDDKVLYNLYSKAYKNINIISGENFESRTNQILEIIEKKISEN